MVFLVMQFPKVSMIIISYNQESYIEEAVLSAVSQDYKNKEVIICDDGSTDDTPEIILKLAKKFPEIIRASTAKENLGITGNCNRALALSTGELMSFQGGDDVLLPGKITAQAKFLDKYRDKVLCFHDVYLLDDKAKCVFGRYSDRHSMKEGGIKDLIVDGCFFCATSVMLRKSFIPIDGFDRRIPKASDWMFWCDVVIQFGGEGIGYIDGVYAKYRRHAGNITNLASIDALNEMMIGFDLLKSKLKGLDKVIGVAKQQRIVIYMIKFLLQKNVIGFFLSLNYFLKGWRYAIPVMFSLMKSKALWRNLIGKKG